jgi:hypothetical protein
LAKAKNWIYTSLAEDDAIGLEIDGVPYKISHCTTTFATNEIPKATVVLAIGRDARTDELAKIAETAPTLTTMLDAKITFHPVGDFDDRGTAWPDEPQVIFEGYFTGFSFRKMHGKVQVSVNLIHWLADLGFSSSLSSVLHTSNPGIILAPAVLTNNAGGSGLPRFAPAHINYDTVAEFVDTDLWQSIKTWFCALAQWKGLELKVDQCEGTGDASVNTRALKALKRIEGPAQPASDPDSDTAAEDCSKPYKYAQKLPLDIGGQPQVADAVAGAIAFTTMESYYHQTFWDVLVKGFLPQFALALVPMIDRALVVADLPGWRGDGPPPPPPKPGEQAAEDTRYWKVIGTDEYVATEQSAKLPRPLRGIGIYSAVESVVNPQTTTENYDAQLGGCFVSDSNEDADGTVLYVSAPRWLLNVPSEGPYAGAVSGNKNQTPTKSATHGDSAPVAKPEAKSPGELSESVSGLMTQYAHALFTQNTLRGRSAIISGKLRFDIAPGSHVKIKGSPEKFLKATDQLAADVYGTVQRVTIGIDAESKTAMTSFVILYNRNDAENEAERTSIADHPLFGDDVFQGAPLREELNLERS